MSLILLFYYINIGSIFVPTIVGISYFHYLNKPSKVLLWTLILGLFQSSLTLFVMNGEDSSAKWLEDLYVIIDILVMFAFYYTAITEKRFQRILLGVTILMIFIYFISLKFKTDIDYFPSLQSMVFNGTALLFFNYLLKNVSNKSILDNPLFWFNTGLLLNGIVLTLRIYSGALAEESFKYYQQLYVFFYMIGISVNILFAIGFRKSKM
jgi:hypothetical protein